MEKSFAARLDPRTSAQPGEKLSLAVNLDGVHVFEPDSGRSLLVR